MSALRFDAGAIKTWADFSGDYNPIHFDDRIADEATGKGGVVVHGMLAMMPLKALLSTQPWEENGWLQWTAMLRQAMPLRSSYTVDTRVAQPGRKLRFKLTDADDAEAKITGHCSVGEFDTAPYAGFQRTSVLPETARAELAHFSALFPSSAAAWIAIDAMLFARYIRYHADDAFRKELAQHFGTEKEEALATGGLVTMQTHHACMFDRSLLGDTVSLDITKFEYGVAKTDEISTDDTMFATVEIPVWINGVMVQVVKIGLMARKKSSVVIN